MKKEFSASYIRRASTGLVAAIAIAFIVVAVCSTIFAIERNLPIIKIWHGDSLVQIFLVAMPYIALAAGGVVARLPWVVGICLTTAFWGFWLFEMTRPYEGGGANIGLILLTMFSPIPILAACVMVARISTKRRTDAKSGGR